MKKRGSSWPFYVVARGICPNVYTSWRMCKENVHKVPGYKYKGFLSRDDAVAFVKKYFRVLRHRPSSSSASTSTVSTSASAFTYEPEDREVCAAQIEWLIVVQKTFPSVILGTLRSVPSVSAVIAKRILHSIKDGVDGNWNPLRSVCASLSLSVANSLWVSPYLFLGKLHFCVDSRPKDVVMPFSGIFSSNGVPRLS